MRCWARADISFRDGLVVISGPNGAGKTTLLEGLAFACLGVSCRTSREAEMVRAGAPATRAELDLEGPAGRTLRSIGFQPGLARRVASDGVPAHSLAAWRAPGAVMIFLPEELRIVKGPPAARRRHVDRVLEASDPHHAARLAGYRAALAQRNALLRRIRAGAASRDGLTGWESQLAALGAQIAIARRGAVRALAPLFTGWLEVLADDPAGGIALLGSPAVSADLPDEELETTLAGHLLRSRERDVAAAQTIGGPHRDDVWIGSGPVDLRRVGSQGEQRTAALALLLAARDHLAAGPGRPILLLDDVLSELDPDRRARLLDAVVDGGQTLVTSADPDAVQAARARAAQALVVRDGAIRE